MSDFQNPGQKVGIEIWRIEKMKVMFGVQMCVGVSSVLNGLCAVCLL